MEMQRIPFEKRLGTMLKVDLRRMFKSRLFYILLACALIVSIVLTVLLCMIDGQENINPQTGEVTIMKVRKACGSLSALSRWKRPSLKPPLGKWIWPPWEIWM